MYANNVIAKQKYFHPGQGISCKVPSVLFLSFFLSSGDSPTCLLLLEQYDLLSSLHSRLSFFYLLVMLFVNFDLIISIFLRILSVMRDISLIEKNLFFFSFGLCFNFHHFFFRYFPFVHFFSSARNANGCPPNIRKTGLSGFNCHYLYLDQLS